MQQNNNQKTALLVMDVQGATVKMLNDSTMFIQSITKAIQSARDNKIVKTGMRKFIVC